MKYTLNELSDNYLKNIKELRDLLKLPEKFDKQAKQAINDLDRFILPISIGFTQKNLNNPPKGITKKDLKKQLAYEIAKYKKLEPQNIDKNGNILVQIDEKYLKNFNKIKRKMEKTNQSISHKIHIEKAVLFNLISYLEQILSDIAHIILKKHPEILQLNDKNVSFDEIKKLDSLDDVKDYIIAQEIEKLLFKPISDFFDFYEKKVFKINFPNLEKFKKELIEIKERRNLLIHNGGIINSKYLNTVDKAIQENYKIKKDEEIPLGKKYLEDSINIIELIGLEILFFSSIKFQNGEEQKKTIHNGISIIYNTFASNNKNLFLGEHFSCFIIEKCQIYLTEIDNDYFKLNYWYILKIQNKLSIVQKIIDKYDVSAKNHIVQLCFYSLIGNIQEACKHLIPSLNSESNFNLNYYEKFPILENLRKSKEAKKIIKKYKRERGKKTKE